MTFIFDPIGVAQLADRMDFAGNQSDDSSAAVSGALQRAELGPDAVGPDVVAGLVELADEYRFVAGVLRNAIDVVEGAEIGVEDLAALTGLDVATVQNRLDLLDSLGITDPVEILAALIGLGSAAAEPREIRDLIPGLPAEGEDPELDATLSRLDTGTLRQFKNGEELTIDSPQERRDLETFVGFFAEDGKVEVPTEFDEDGNVVASELVDVGDLSDDELIGLATVGLAVATTFRQATIDRTAASDLGLDLGDGDDTGGNDDASTTTSVSRTDVQASSTAQTSSQSSGGLSSSQSSVIGDADTGDLEDTSDALGRRDDQLADQQRGVQGNIDDAPRTGPAVGKAVGTSIGGGLGRAFGGPAAGPAGAAGAAAGGFLGGKVGQALADDTVDSLDGRLSEIEQERQQVQATKAAIDEELATRTDRDPDRDENGRRPDRDGDGTPDKVDPFPDDPTRGLIDQLEPIAPPPEGPPIDQLEPIAPPPNGTPIDQLEPIAPPPNGTPIDQLEPIAPPPPSDGGDDDDDDDDGTPIDTQPTPIDQAEPIAPPPPPPDDDGSPNDDRDDDDDDDGGADNDNAPGADSEGSSGQGRGPSGQI